MEEAQRALEAAKVFRYYSATMVAQAFTGCCDRYRHHILTGDAFLPCWPGGGLQQPPGGEHRQADGQEERIHRNAGEAGGGQMGGEGRWFRRCSVVLFPA